MVSLDRIPYPLAVRAPDCSQGMNIAGIVENWEDFFAKTRYGFLA
jgi:hypothetical protein